MPLSSSIIGAPVGRVEGIDKVSGRATYGADVHFQTHYGEKSCGVRTRMPVSKRLMCQRPRKLRE
jgi:hypothetical protein